MEIGLENGAVLRIDGRRQPFTLRCQKGCLWLTRTGDRRDYFLTAGEQRAFGRTDSVVVEAWGATSLLCLTPVAVEAERQVAISWHVVSMP